MPTIKHILLPLDFSAASLAAIPYVRALANQFHAKVTVLSIVPPTWVAPPGLIVSPAGSDPEVLQSTLQAHLDKQAIEGFETPPARLTTAVIAEFAVLTTADFTSEATEPAFSAAACPTSCAFSTTAPTALLAASPMVCSLCMTPSGYSAMVAKFRVLHSTTHAE